MIQTMQASRTYDRVLKPEAGVVRRMIDDLMIPSSEKIRQIAATGSIPVVVFEPMGGTDEICDPPPMARLWALVGLKAPPGEVP
jgi:hypothetical protein